MNRARSFLERGKNFGLGYKFFPFFYLRVLFPTCRSVCCTVEGADRLSAEQTVSVADSQRSSRSHWAQRPVCSIVQQQQQPAVIPAANQFSPAANLALQATQQQAADYPKWTADSPATFIPFVVPTVCLLSLVCY